MLISGYQRILALPYAHACSEFLYLGQGIFGDILADPTLLQV
jgi:hypothetical protein